MHFELELVLSVLLYLHGFSLRKVRLEHFRLQPLQVPPVINREHGVITRDNGGKRKSTVTVTLVAAKQDLVVCGIIGHGNNHHSGQRLAIAQRNPSDLALAFTNRDLQRHRRSALDHQGSAIGPWHPCGVMERMNELTPPPLLMDIS